jgi:hypothetical protein
VRVFNTVFYILYCILYYVLYSVLYSVFCTVLCTVFCTLYCILYSVLYLRASFGDSARNTLSKLSVLAKFCVMAIVSSKFSTACHHMEGTNTVQSTFCTN